MSFRSRSPRLILEFVAMGRERSLGKVGEEGEGRDEDNFLCLARDWRVCCDLLAKPSNEGDFPSESICL
jgi:hypothetical protein